MSFNDLIPAGAMRFGLHLLIAPFLAASFFAFPAAADPAQDLINFRQYYRTLFPQVEFDDFANGLYAIDPVARESWLAIEEFPPYEEAVDRGKTLFNAPFHKTGKTYADCLPNQGIGIAQHYPMWSRERGEVITLSKALNDCRRKNLESPLDAEKGELEFYGKKYGKEDARFSRSLLERMKTYEWPGNIRQLQHAVEKAVILSEGNSINLADMYGSMSANVMRSNSLSLQHNEKYLIMKAIEMNRGNLAKSSRDLGISRKTLYNKIRRYEI